MSRSYNFCFTLNNPTDSTRSIVDSLECRYMVYGEEVGESGTPHLQGVVCFVQQRSLSSAIKALAGCHVEIMKGSVQQAVTYAKKDGRVTERGTAPVHPGKRERDDWDGYLDSIKRGRSDELPAKLQITLSGHIQRLESKYAPVPSDLPPGTISGLWIYGDSKVGKSHWFREQYPDFHHKRANKWWDGYTGQPTVLLEDIDSTHAFLAHDLNVWVDRYWFPAEIKGGMTKIRPTLVAVTSRYSIDEVFASCDQSTRDSLERRFTVRHMVKPENQAWQSR